MGGRTHGKTTDEVLQEIKKIHGDKLLYDRFEYKNCKTKVIVGCSVHSDYYFEKWPNDLKNNSGCPKCSGNYRKTNEEFLLEIKNMFPYIKVIGSYKNAKTKIEFNCNKHNHRFTTDANGILSGHVNCPECIVEKSIETKLSNSQSVIDPMLKSEFELYRRAVWRYSNRTYRKYMFEEKRDRQNHLDHILSIVDGFKNNIDPEIVGSIHNLRILNGQNNRKKSYKSEITPEELLNRWVK